MEQKTQEKGKNEEKIIRIMSTDIEGKIKVYPGLAKVKGISWAVSNAICKILKIDKTRKIGSLTSEEMKKITEFMKNPAIPEFLKNRKLDFETGENRHLISTNLELRKDFDIKRLKKIRNYRGLRHTLKLPLRGQRTKGHFRKNMAKSVGIKQKSK